MQEIPPSVDQSPEQFTTQTSSSEQNQQPSDEEGKVLQQQGDSVLNAKWVDPDTEEARLLLKKLPLMEMFGPTVQGEGSVIGQMTYFFRFGLCDYKCKMCDSMHAVDPNSVHNNATWLTQDEILAAFEKARRPLSTKWITFSGGNPCIHNLDHLTDALISNGFQIAVETQGTFAPSWLFMCDVVTVSPKSPGMGERFEERKFLDFVQKFKDHNGLAVKVVVFSPEDLAFAEWVFKIAMAAGVRASQLFLSQGNPFPPGFKVPPENHIDCLRRDYLELLERIQANRILSRAKFLPQWHVWLWQNKQGV